MRPLQPSFHKHQVLVLYLGLHGEPLTIRALLRLTDDDDIIGRRLYDTVSMNVYSPARRIFSPTTSGSLGTDVLSRAATDPAVAAVLSLIGYVATDWPRIYDIIEFLGGERSIAASGFAPRSQIRRVRQTANHYRHLGSPNKPPLPRVPPTLREASIFAKELVKKWIATRIELSCDSG
jgi:hypothetical protein